MGAVAHQHRPAVQDQRISWWQRATQSVNLAGVNLFLHVRGVSACVSTAWRYTAPLCSGCNGAASRTFCTGEYAAQEGRLMQGNEALAIPHVSVPDIRWVDWTAVKRAGFKGAAFDKDNTLTLPFLEKVSLACWQHWRVSTSTLRILALHAAHGWGDQIADGTGSEVVAPTSTSFRAC